MPTSSEWRCDYRTSNVKDGSDQLPIPGFREGTQVCIKNMRTCSFPFLLKEECPTGQEIKAESNPKLFVQIHIGSEALNRSRFISSGAATVTGR